MKANLHHPTGQEHKFRMETRRKKNVAGANVKANKLLFRTTNVWVSFIQKLCNYKNYEKGTHKKSKHDGTVNEIFL